MEQMGYKLSPTQCEELCPVEAEFMAQMETKWFFESEKEKLKFRNISELQEWSRELKANTMKKQEWLMEELYKVIRKLFSRKDDLEKNKARKRYDFIINELSMSEVIAKI